MIAEMAMREYRPGHRILRATKVLGISSWSGAGYRLVDDSPEQVLAYLDAVPVDLLVIDVKVRPDRPRDEHTSLLLSTAEQHSDRWRLAGPPASPDGTVQYRIYQRVHGG